MTGYSRRWDCRICKESQESIDYPVVEVCEACLRPVARTLCHDVLGVTLASEGVDERYWMGKADRLVGPMFKRWRSE